MKVVKETKQGSKEKKAQTWPEDVGERTFENNIGTLYCFLNKCFNNFLLSFQTRHQTARNNEINYYHESLY